jgi:biotin-(acetyl-CoA carboxylase) ligase
VLVEAHSQGHRVDAVIVGIGVNLRAGEAGWPPELAATATSMEQAAGAPVDRAAFIDQLLAQVERWIDRYIASGIAAIAPAWRDRMAPGITARARVDGVELCGELAGLDGDGALLLRDAGGELHRVRSGDVELIKPLAAPGGAAAP